MPCGRSFRGYGRNCRRCGPTPTSWPPWVVRRCRRSSVTSSSRSRGDRMLTGRRYRLNLTPEQADYAEMVGGICRAVWNTALEQRRAYRQRGGWINYNEQAGQLADAKTEHDVLQQTLMDLDRACREHG